MSGAPAGAVDRRLGIARQAWSVAALPLISILLALLVGAAIILASELLIPNQEFDLLLPLRAYAALVQGAIGFPPNVNAIVSTLVATAPLVLAGLSVGLAFKAGLFNIGAQGQFLMGALGAVATGIAVSSQPSVIAIPIALAGGMLAGAAWGFIPGILKAVSGAHEVVTTIMLNYVAQWLVRYLIVGGPLQLPHGFSVSSPIGAGARLPTFLPSGDNSLIVFGLPAGVYRVHTGLLIALVALAVFAFLLWRTALGYEIRAAGQSQRAARYAGVSVPRTVVVTMLIAGAFSGLAGAIQIAGVDHNLSDKYFNDTTGFDAIAVALLGLGSAVGILLASILFGALHAGGSVMQADAGISSSLVQVVQALILFSIAANFLRVLRFPNLGRRRPAQPPPAEAAKVT